MYEIIFYEDKNGKSEVLSYIHHLKKQMKTSKDDAVKFNKIMAFLKMVEVNGLQLGYPYIKHIVNDIWELRPLDNRILFAYWHHNQFVILSIFRKQTQKTPHREIEKAERLWKDFNERNEKDV